MSNLPARRPSLGLSRQVAKDIERSQAEAVALAARESAQVEAIARVTHHALTATAHISTVELALAQQAPWAEARLRHVADAGAITISRTVLAMGDRL